MIVVSVSAIRRLCLLLSFCVISCSESCLAAGPKERLGPLMVRWQRIERSGRNSTFPENSEDRWWDTAEECQLAFVELCKIAPADESLAFFVDQFGKHGAEADIRWMIADPALTVPGIFGFGPFSQSPETSELICEAIVRRASRDPKFVTRYWRLVVWTRRFLRSESLEESSYGQGLLLANAGLDDGEEGCWHWARTFVLLAHAVGRDDLYRDPDLDKLSSAARQLRSWVKENKAKLRSDDATLRCTLDPQLPAIDPQIGCTIKVPERPFKDWIGVVPDVHHLEEWLIDVLPP